MLTIKEKKRILKILSKGKVYEGLNFRIYYSKSDSTEAGFVVTVPRKLGNAVKRNYIKRVIKNILRHKNFEYDLIIRPKLADVDYRKTKGELEKFWRMLNG